jgi:hypothetical protein
MEGQRNTRVLAVSRRYEPNRLEEEIWALAYEQVWPILRKTLSPPRPVAQDEKVPRGSPRALARSA